MIEKQEMDNVQDSFTLSDRRELIRQGLQLESMQQDLIDIKVLVNDTTNRDNYEQRLRRLENDFLVAETKSRAYIGVVSAIVSIFSVVATLAVEYFRHG